MTELLLNCTVDDIDPAYDRWLAGDASVPETCQQFGCAAPVETWCPLCRAFFCAEHDELTPVRRHDCLRGKAEAA